MFAAYKDNDDAIAEWRRCKDCDYKDERHENAKEFFTEVVKQLYSYKDLDISTLEIALDEVCHYFDMKLCPGDLMVERFKEVEHV